MLDCVISQHLATIDSRPPCVVSCTNDQRLLSFNPTGDPFYPRLSRCSNLAPSSHGEASGSECCNAVTCENVQILLLDQQLRFRSFGCSFNPVQFNMKLLTLFSGLLCASSALAFKKPVKPTLPRAVVEKRVPNQPFSHPEIQKRASRFLTEKTKCMLSQGT